jgi:tRNA uridine 5-carboxymethylaminomethyl modification enzyme
VEQFKKIMKHFDVLILGGGHAGVESAYMASQFGINVGLITMPGVSIASAPCNPSIGGVGKGQVVRELDCLGGAMGILADKAGIQYRTLNESKGYALQSTRVQIDKDLYSAEAEKFIASQKNVEVIRERVISVTVNENGEFIVAGSMGPVAKAYSLVVTVGTFLNGKLHQGQRQLTGGRMTAEASPGLNDLFSLIETRPARFKTGTPARIFKDSIDYSQLEVQPSDEKTRNLHLFHESFERAVEQVDCYLTKTNRETIEIIRENKESSPMFNGQIQGVGARYCPSIEDKAYRYPEKENHHVFIEPEGLESLTVYPSGISSSLPIEVQDKFIRTILGLENCKIERYGYAVEYDVVDTTQLKLTLEHKKIKNLYFAGQVNGTSGYEEAAGQGLIAGINAALEFLGRDPFILSRRDSYIGVMIEDLVTNTRDEPYRLFTARSENRLSIREDNTHLRMHKYRKLLNLSSEFDLKLSELVEENLLLERLVSSISYGRNFLRNDIYGLNDLIFKAEKRMSLKELLRQSWVDPIVLLNHVLSEYGLYFRDDVVKNVAISAKYEGYINRADEQFLKVSKLEEKKLNLKLILESENISFECKHRINTIQPETFGQLKRITGIRPATLAMIANAIL